MSTDAKRAANSRYLAKMAAVTIRMTPQEKAQVQQAAEKSGKSVQGYILELIRKDR